MKPNFETEINFEIVNADKSSFVKKEFKCRDCRAFNECKSISDCRMIDYLNSRVPQIKTSIKYQPVITVLSSDDFFDRTRVYVRRAIRLRRNRCR